MATDIDRQPLNSHFLYLIFCRMDALSDTQLCQSTNIPPQLFYGPLSGTTWVSQCQKKASSGLYGGRKVTRGRHINNPGGRHSIQTNQQSTSINLPTFTPDALPAATLPIHPGFGEAQEYAGLHIPWLRYPCGLVVKALTYKIKIQDQCKGQK